MMTDRTMEQYVLGTALENPTAVLGDHHDLPPEAFSTSHHRELWSLLLEMSSKRAHIDIVTVGGRIKDNAERYGGMAYVMGLMDNVAGASVDHHVGVLRDLAHRRETVDRMQTAISRIKAGDDVEESLAGVDAVSGTSSGGLVHAADVVDATIDRLVAGWAAMERGGDPYMQLPWPSLSDRFRLPMKGGKQILIAARPGMGKTAIGIQILQHVATTQLQDENGGTRWGRCAVYSLEMDQEDLMMRCASIRSGVSARAMTHGNIPADQRKRFTDELDRLRTADLWVDATPARSAEEIRRRLRRHVARYGKLDCVMVDYAGLVKRDTRNQRDDQALGAVAKILREAARELGFNILLLWQLNRGVESRTPPIPKMSDLRGSGEAEQHADGIVFIYRDDYYNEESTSRPGEADIITAKWRGGEPGTDILGWEGPCTRFNVWDGPVARYSGGY